MEKEKEVSIPEAAEILGVSTQRVWVLVRRGKLPGRKRGRDWWIDREAVEARKKGLEEMV